MQSILTYHNYRDYILDFYSEYKVRNALTWQKFAESAGFAAVSYLKLVSQNKANLSDEGIEKTARSMNLVGYEKDYFRELVHFDQAVSAAEKEESFKNITEIASKYKAVILKDDEYDFYSNWQNIVLREMVSQLPAKAKSFNIARQFIQPVTANEVSQSLKFLKRKGLIKQKEDGTFEQTDKVLSTGDKNISSQSVRAFHQKMSEFAADAIKNEPLEERNVSDLVVGITKENYDEIVKEIRAFRKRILAIATKNNEMERVYCMHINMFPLTHKTNKKRSK